MLTYNTLVVLLGACALGALAGVVGVFAVLRRRALLGDTVAHAALPGVVLAFWLTREKALPVLLFGALITGLLAVAALAALRRHTRTKDDAAMALVLSVLFGAGIALSRHVQNAVTDGSTAGLDSFLLGKTAGIVLADVVPVAAVAAIAVAAVALFFRQLRLVGFDPVFARTLGWRTAWIDFATMALLAITVVVGLPMAGVVLVAALTILPAVAARFWTDRLGTMLWVAAVLGVLCAAGGVLTSAGVTKMPTGPVMILFGAGAFLLSACFAPNRGVIGHVLRDRRFGLEVGARALVRRATGGAVLASEPGIAGGERAIDLACRRGWLVRVSEGWVPTDAGRAAVEEVEP